jgi:hypothetical protein
VIEICEVQSGMGRKWRPFRLMMPYYLHLMLLVSLQKIKSTIGGNSQIARRQLRGSHALEHGSEGLSCFALQVKGSGCAKDTILENGAFLHRFSLRYSKAGTVSEHGCRIKRTHAISHQPVQPRSPALASYGSARQRQAPTKSPLSRTVR